MLSFIAILLIAVFIGTAIFCVWGIMAFLRAQIIVPYMVYKAFQKGTDAILTDFPNNPFEGSVSRKFKIIELKRNRSGEIYVKYEEPYWDEEKVETLSRLINYDEIKVMTGNEVILLIDMRKDRVFLPPKVKVNNLRKSKNVQ